MSARPYSRRSGLVLFGAALVLLLFFGGSLCSLLIDYKWWGEMGQVDTWGGCGYTATFPMSWVADPRRGAVGRARPRHQVRGSPPEEAQPLLANGHRGDSRGLADFDRRFR